MLKGRPLPLECFKLLRNTCFRLHCLSGYSGLLLHLCCLYSGNKGEQGPRCMLPATVYHVYNLNADGPCVLKGNYLIWNRSRRGKCCPGPPLMESTPSPATVRRTQSCVICAVLCCVMLFCVMLCCVVLCWCAMLCCAVLMCYAVLCCFLSFFLLCFDMLFLLCFAVL